MLKQKSGYKKRYMLKLLKKTVLCNILKAKELFCGGIKMTDNNTPRNKNYKGKLPQRKLSYEERKSLSLEQRQQLRKLERERRKRQHKIKMTIAAICLLVLVIILVVVGINSCSKASPTANNTESKLSDNSESSKISATAVQPTEAQTTAPQATTQGGTQADDNTPLPTTPTTPDGKIADDGSDGYLDNSIYIWNNKAFELFGGSDDSAQYYAKAISNYKEQLGSDITVYNMVVPNHTEFGLPERLSKDYSNSQKQNTAAVYNSYTSDVKAVDIYNALDSHKSEYIYFNTDHHWTGLGAYYAYTEFARVAGITPVDIGTMENHRISPFLGSLYTATENSSLGEHPDFVEYYNIPVKAKVTITTEDMGELEEDTLLNSATESGAGAYCVFSWGDQPLIKAVRETKATNRKIAVVKDSYGNAFAPYLLNNYDEVHIIDFRTFGQNLKTYCTENGITEVLFLNNVMSANTSFQVDKLDALFN